jgi:hypothetical protein
MRLKTQLLATVALAIALIAVTGGVAIFGLSQLVRAVATREAHNQRHLRP